MSDIPFSPGERVAAYARDSGGAEQELSTQRQGEEILRWCMQNDLILVRAFIDEAKTGGTTIGREQLFKLLAWLESSPDIAGVVVWEYDRWARNFDDASYFVASIRRKGYKFYSLTNPIPGGAVGRVVESLYFYAAEEESKKLSKRVRSGMHYIISTYKTFPFPRIPVGYRGVPVEIGPKRDGTIRTGTRLEPDPDVAPLVRRAFEMRASGATFREIHELFDFYASLSPYGHMMRNQIYIGTLHTRFRDFPDICEPIVDPATFHEVQDINKRRARRKGPSHPRRVRSQYLLSGLVRCAICGGPMVGEGTVKYKYYRCRERRKGRCRAEHIRREVLEDAVIDFIGREALDPARLVELHKNAQEMIGKFSEAESAQLALMRKEQSDVKRGIRHVLDALGERGSSAALLDELSRLEERQSEIAVQMVALEAQVSAREAALSIPVSEVPRLARETLASLRNGNQAARHDIVHDLVVSVSVRRTEDELRGQVTYRVPVAGIDEERVGDL